VNGPLDVLEVRKLGVPGHEELAMGAVAAGGVLVLNPEVVSALAIDRTTLDVAIAAARLRLADQHRRFRGDHPPAPREGRQVVLVDDGLATGATMEAAIGSCRLAGVAGIVVAVPVGAPATVARMASLADRVFCPLTPPDFRAVGLAYRDFSPVDEQVVVALLDAARGGRARP
jgi:predicted phosphoribosyltransferase